LLTAFLIVERRRPRLRGKILILNQKPKTKSQRLEANG
jgi:hypothetical protein